MPDFLRRKRWCSSGKTTKIALLYTYNKKFTHVSKQASFERFAVLERYPQPFIN